MIKEGVVEGINQKPDRYGVLIEGVWYNGFGNFEGKKGDNVRLEYETKGAFNNISKAEVVKIESETIESSKLDRSADIHFQVCLKIASEQLKQVSPEVTTPKQLIDYAKENPIPAIFSCGVLYNGVPIIETLK